MGKDRKEDQGRCTVLVTGVGGRSVGHQVLHALQSEADLYRVMAVDSDAFSFGLYDSDAACLVPRADEPGYLSAIMELVERERVVAVLPGSEAELPVLAEAAPSFADKGCHVIANPPDLISLCLDKWRLYQWLCEHEIGTPRTVRAGDWSRLAEQVGFPLVAKPATETGGSRGVTLVKNAADAERYIAEHTGDLLFQEYLSEDGEEYTVGVLVSFEGELIDSVALQRKLVGLSLSESTEVDGRAYKLSTGYSQGVFVDATDVREQCERLALTLGARGPLNIQCRLKEGRIMVFEVHPRFSGTASMRADIGFNEPHVLLQNKLYGTACERLNYKRDVAAIRAFRHIVVPLEQMARLEKLPTDA